MSEPESNIGEPQEPEASAGPFPSIDELYEHVEPWPAPVEGNELLFDIVRFMRRFLVTSDDAYNASALWIAHTYAFDLFPISPILAFCSPNKRCGKTTALHLLEGLSNRPLMSSNISPAALFRVVERDRPTLLIDELDSQRRSELTNLLNGGHHQKARVIRFDPRRGPRAFSTYSPKALATIGMPPTTVADRSIIVAMTRRTREDAQIEKLRPYRVTAEFLLLKRQLLTWATDHRDQLQHAEPVVPTDLHDRAQDNWRPLMAIAELCGRLWTEAAHQAARRLLQTYEEEDVGLLLLHDIRAIRLENSTADRIPSSELADLLSRMEDRPWYDWPRSKGFSPHQLADLLRPYGIKPKPMWNVAGVTKGTKRGYFFADFDDAFARYLEPPTELTSEQLPPDPDRLKLRKHLDEVGRRSSRPRGAW